MAIKISTSGIRGLYSELTPSRIARFSQAFATYLRGGNIALCSDLRPSGVFMREAVIAGLTSCGARVHDFGILPTPVLQWIIRQGRFRGGISISANHNPLDWNSLIFLNQEGAYLHPLEGEELFNLVHANRPRFRTHDQIGACIPGDMKRVDRYFRALSLPPGDGKNRRFMIDCANGFGPDIVRRLEQSLNAVIGAIYTGGTGESIKDPEPNPANAATLATLVRETGSDGGFLVNSDASRLLLVDEKGRILSEEMTFPLFADILLRRDRHDLITSYSTAGLIERVANKHGVKVYRTDIGQPNVVHMAHETRNTIGGEGNGSTIYTPFSYGFDSFHCISIILGHLRENSITLSQLAEEWKEPEIIREAVPMPAPQIYAALDRIGKMFPEKVEIKDGFYMRDGEKWLCIRASSTAALIRLIGEGPGIASEISRIEEFLS